MSAIQWTTVDCQVVLQSKKADASSTIGFQANAGQVLACAGPDQYALKHVSLPQVTACLFDWTAQVHNIQLHREKDTDVVGIDLVKVHFPAFSDQTVRAYFFVAVPPRNPRLSTLGWLSERHLPKFSHSPKFLCVCVDVF
jgi:hypothetical protein